MKRTLALLAAAAMSCLTFPALAEWSLGYGVAGQMPTDPVPDSGNGLELRLTFGGDRGDLWSIWLGAQPERKTRDKWAYGVWVDTMPAYAYVAGLRRFNLRLDGPVTLFAGTGLGYRDLTTCTVLYQGKQTCFGGDAFVSARWSFAQELGFRWQPKQWGVEMQLGHFSTGGISKLNHGVNFLKFGMVIGLGERH